MSRVMSDNYSSSFEYSGNCQPFPETWKNKGHFRPAYGGNIPQIPDNFRQLEDQERAEIITNRSRYMKSLTSTFYHYLAREFLMGDTLHEGGLNMTKGHNGQEYIYLPDIVRSIGGRGKNKIAEEHVEVKACNSRNKILAPPAQTAKYAATLYDGKFEGSKLANIETIMFRYYPRQSGRVSKRSKISTARYSNPKLLPMSELSGYELTDFLAQNTNDCMMVPLNLYLMLFRSGNESLNAGDRQEFKEVGVPPNFVKDVRIRAGLHSSLVDVKATLDDLLKYDQDAFFHNSKRFKLKPSDPIVDLHLDKLKVRHIELPNSFIACHGDSSYPVKPFVITEYYMTPKDNAKWLKHFRQNFAVIMQQSGLENFGSVVEVVPKSKKESVDEDVPF